MIMIIKNRLGKDGILAGSQVGGKKHPTPHNLSLLSTEISIIIIIIIIVIVIVIIYIVIVIKMLLTGFYVSVPANEFSIQFPGLDFLWHAFKMMTMTTQIQMQIQI